MYCSLLSRQDFWVIVEDYPKVLSFRQVSRGTISLGPLLKIFMSWEFLDHSRGYKFEQQIHARLARASCFSGMVCNLLLVFLSIQQLVALRSRCGNYFWFTPTLKVYVTSVFKFVTTGNRPQDKVNTELSEFLLPLNHLTTLSFIWYS